MYIVGGMDASTKGPTTVEKFCLRQNSWSSPATSMTGRRLQFGVAVVEGKIFVVGGRDGLKTLSTVNLMLALLSFFCDKLIFIFLGRVVGPLDKIVEFDASYGNTQTWYKCPDV